MAKNQRLIDGIQTYSNRLRVSYPEGVHRLAQEVGYKNHRRIYAAINRGGVSARFEHKIARALRKTVDYLFGEQDKEGQA